MLTEFYVTPKRLRDMADSSSQAKFSPYGFRLDEKYKVLDIIVFEQQKEVKLLMFNDIGELRLMQMDMFVHTGQIQPPDPQEDLFADENVTDEPESTKDVSTKAKPPAKKSTKKDTQ